MMLEEDLKSFEAMVGFALFCIAVMFGEFLDIIPDPYGYIKYVIWILSIIITWHAGCTNRVMRINKKVFIYLMPWFLFILIYILVYNRSIYKHSFYTTFRWLYYFSFVLLLPMVKECVYPKLINVLKAISGIYVFGVYFFLIFPYKYRIMRNIWGYWPTGTDGGTVGYHAGFANHYSENAMYIVTTFIIIVAQFLVATDRLKKRWLSIQMLIVAFALVATTKRAHVLFGVVNMYQKDTFKLVKVNDISEYKISKVVVGSDQVWNLELTGGDLNYFLPFVEPECRISYAASVGHVGDNIDKKIFEEKLSLFDSISVREKELADMINSLNINKKAVICMDPVFLKSKLAWKEYIADTDININFPYILVFIMGVSKQADYIVRRALEVGKKNNCQVILIGDQERWYKYRQVKHFGVATPREFIKLIDSAKCVFTNSFHATAFSIILNSSFYTEMNISNNGRIESLLNLAGLESRKMYDGKLNSLYTTKINWDIVTKKLQPEIEKSKKFLQVNL